ncbi:hypothetical protein [Lacrimispora sp. JR3]|uniref:hypothetical protein n=1 Tax=Lacrimispora sinapis TaxID=3111456 RepID=UPI003748FDD4
MMINNDNRKGVETMVKYWSWGGRYIGVRQKDYLVACDGTVLGKFYGTELYNQNGDYIGELGRNNRLIKNLTKDNNRRPSFSGYVKGTVTAPLKDCAPYSMIPGFMDFS